MMTMYAVDLDSGQSKSMTRLCACIRLCHQESKMLCWRRMLIGGADAYLYYEGEVVDRCGKGRKESDDGRKVFLKELGAGEGQG